MREISTDIEINATPQQVWDVLADFEHYSEWNPFMIKASGKAVAGVTLEVTIRPPEKKERQFKRILTKVVENQELRWQGFMYIGGLVDVEHIAIIEEIEPDRIRLVQRDLFNGLLVPFFWGSIKESTKSGMIAMNEALKEKIENQ